MRDDVAGDIGENHVSPIDLIQRMVSWLQSEVSSGGGKESAGLQV